MLTIALVSDAIYPYNIGGKEKRIYEVSKRLVQRGHHVTIYTMKWWKGSETQVINEGVVHEAISPLYKLYSGDRRSMREAIMFAFHCFKLLGKDFDVLEADHMPHLVLFPIKIVCVIKRKKLIATWNEVWGRKYWMKYLGKLGIAAYLIEQLSVLMPDKFISISKYTADKLRKDLKVKKEIVVIPNGIDLSAMKRIKKAKLTSDVIYTGRLLEHKNVDKLIQAIDLIRKEFPNIICRIVGNGPEEMNLKLLTKTLKLEKHVIFHDFLSDNNDVFAMIKASKLFVLPSSREGFGIVAIEAQSLGVPVITYNHPNNAATELIKDGKNGYLFDIQKTPLDSVLKKALTQTLDPKTLTDYAKEYDWDQITGRIEREYKK